MNIIVASDHSGFEIKKILTKTLSDLGYVVTDMGPLEYNPQDDYPDFIIPAAIKLSKDTSSNKGIFICRNGVGASISANKIKGVRCALTFAPNHAVSSVKDDNTNAIALPADYIPQHELIDIVKEWLNASFSNEERHNRRLSKFSELGSE